MPEVKTYTLTLTEIAELLIKKLDIHEGLWGAYIEFGLAAANVPIGPEVKGAIAPAVIGVLHKFGIQRFDSPNNLTVDAAKVNPIRKPRRTLSSGPKSTGQ
jgi:hypothetical protein